MEAVPAVTAATAVAPTVLGVAQAVAQTLQLASLPASFPVAVQAEAGAEAHLGVPSAVVTEEPELQLVPKLGRGQGPELVSELEQRSGLPCAEVQVVGRAAAGEAGVVAEPETRAEAAAWADAGPGIAAGLEA